MIYAIKTPREEDFENSNDFQNVISGIKKSIHEDGYSRFGWGFFDLNQLKDKDWNEMMEDEIDVWKRSSFLLEVKQDDWLVHINFPEYGKCTACKVSGGYEFRELIQGDFGHGIKIDKDSIVTFDRNDDGVLPIISQKLKLPTRVLKNAIDLSIKKNLPISLIAGDDVAKFVLKYAPDLLV